MFRIILEKLHIVESTPQRQARVSQAKDLFEFEMTVREEIRKCQDKIKSTAPLWTDELKDQR